MTDREFEPVKCDECGTPVGEIVGDVLIIKSQHHGRPHVTVLNLRKLLERKTKEREPAKVE